MLVKRITIQTTWTFSTIVFQSFIQKISFLEYTYEHIYVRMYVCMYIETAGCLNDGEICPQIEQTNCIAISPVHSAASTTGPLLLNPPVLPNNITPCSVPTLLWVMERHYIPPTQGIVLIIRKVYRVSN
jgi:hypothetical protein